MQNNTKGKCPFNHGSVSHNKIENDWWKASINLDILHQHDKKTNPFEEDYNYRQAFKSLDLEALKQDLKNLMTESQDWWPADWGHYGGLMIRMAWHSAGTYRTFDGRGGSNSGNLRFSPLNSWPDNGNLDKARRLLWPIKQKYGNKISWADLMILAGNMAYESMGFKTLGFSGGREDIWHPEKDIYWGGEKEWLTKDRYSNDNADSLEAPLGAVELGLIYVNPEGVDGNPDPLKTAHDVRETFKRMGMNDEETVALIAGGHTVGKAHGNGNGDLVSQDPENSSIENQGFGWKNENGKGNAEDTMTSGLEGAWTTTPNKWNHTYFHILLNHDWESVKSPAGAWQWEPVSIKDEDKPLDAHIPNQKQNPIMTDADMALKLDPNYKVISEKFYKDPAYFEKIFAEAWFKLTHRDLGPATRYLGNDIPKQEFIWQDPVKKSSISLSSSQIDQVKSLIQETRFTNQELISAAWKSARTFRSTDFRGGANGARVTLAPFVNWKANEPEKFQKLIKAYQAIKEVLSFEISIADLIVLGGSVGIENSITDIKTKVPFIDGRTDVSINSTDIESYNLLEPKHDAFVNYYPSNLKEAPEQLLIDQAHLLGLTAVEMTVLLAGFRSLGVNYNETSTGVLTHNKGILNNEVLKNLTSMDYKWEPKADNLYSIIDRKSGNEVWEASRVDLVFGSNSVLRAYAEFYAQDDNKDKFIKDFIKVWTKIMNADRYDLQ